MIASLKHQRASLPEPGYLDGHTRMVSPRPSPPPPGLVRRHHRHNALAWALLVVGLGGMLAVSFVVSPQDIDEGRVWLTPTCPTKRFFGVECPTCGMTRAFASLSRGQWGDAMRYNRASPWVYGLMWMGMAWGAANSLRSLREARRAERRSTIR